MMKDLTIFVPLNQYDEEVLKLLKDALGSVREQDKDVTIEVSCPSNKVKDITKDVSEYNVSIHTIEDESKSDFCSQVNDFAKRCTTKWFSILEYDDAYTPFWLKNVEEYSSYYQDIDVYLPLVEIHDYNTSNMIGYVNEIVWASSFSDKLGYVDFDSLEAVNEYNFTGGIIKTDVFNELGGLKPSIKISFWQEFMLRLCYNEHKVFVIPKVGYYHIIGRDGSLSSTYNKEIGEDEAKWWMELAKQEYFFKEDRKNEYNPNIKTETISDLK